MVWPIMRKATPAVSEEHGRPEVRPSQRDRTIKKFAVFAVRRYTIREGGNLRTQAATAINLHAAAVHGRPMTVSSVAQAPARACTVGRWSLRVTRVIVFLVV